MKVDGSTTLRTGPAVIVAVGQLDFIRSWTALLTAVAELPDEDFAQPSGCTGWLVRDRCAIWSSTRRTS